MYVGMKLRCAIVFLFLASHVQLALGKKISLLPANNGVASLVTDKAKDDKVVNELTLPLDAHAVSSVRQDSRTVKVIGTFSRLLETITNAMAESISITFSVREATSASVLVHWTPGRLDSRTVKVIGTSQCNNWATGGNFQKALDGHLATALGPLNISYDCGSGRYMLFDHVTGMAQEAGHQWHAPMDESTNLIKLSWAVSAKTTALSACKGQTPPDVIVVFVGGGEVLEEHGQVPAAELRGEASALVDALEDGCSKMPKVLFVPAPVAAQAFKNGTQKKRAITRHALLRESMQKAAEANDHVSMLDMGAAEDFDVADFCVDDSGAGPCDALHFCRLRIGKTCNLLETITKAMAESISREFLVPRDVRAAQVGTLFLCLGLLVALTVAGIALGFTREVTVGSSARVFLPQIAGFRFWACLWIIAGHFLQPTNATASFLERGPCAVSFFVVLSGFMTHYVYGRKLDRGSNPGTEHGQHAWQQYVVDRFARILPTYYLGVLLALLAMALRRDLLDRMGLAATVCLVQAWAASVGSEAWHGLNGPLWTLSSLTFAWLSYPWLLRMWRRSLGQASIATALLAMLGTQCLLLAIWACMIGLGASSLPAYNGFRTCPLQVAMQFAMGCVAAEMLNQFQWTPLHRCSWLCGALGDVGLMAMPLLCAQLPRYEARTGVEGFFVAGFVFLQANLLLLTAVAPGLLARLAAHKLMAGLGSYSFAMYALQEPLATFFWTYWYGTAPQGSAVKFSMGAWSMFVAFLTLVCGLVSELLEPSMVQALKSYGSFSKSPYRH